MPLPSRHPLAPESHASPLLVAAPMAGLTHSAFRRLLAEFGGCDLVYTEMLAGTRLLVEAPDSPYIRRHAGDGRVVYQLLLRDERRVEQIIDKLRACRPDGLDINCACPAAGVRFIGGGADLFEDAARLDAVLNAVRRAWQGPLSVKIRLGRAPETHWRERLLDRLQRIRDAGVDSLTVNPRFAVDRLTRPARHDLLPWICAEAGMPVLANGDITGPETLAAHPAHFADCAGVMLGRMAVVRPWVYAAWRQGEGYAAPDAGAVWRRLITLLQEDFPPERVVLRLKHFTGWYSRNFVYGHLLAGKVRHLRDAETLIRITEEFLASAPATVRTPPLYDL
jgi:tRNA-dihydrouridine synthase